MPTACRRAGNPFPLPKLEVEVKGTNVFITVPMNILTMGKNYGYDEPVLPPGEDCASYAGGWVVNFEGYSCPQFNSGAYGTGQVLVSIAPNCTLLVSNTYSGVISVNEDLSFLSTVQGTPCGVMTVSGEINDSFYPMTVTGEFFLSMGGGGTFTGHKLS